MSEKTMKNIPKLRFPEFVNDGEWEEKKLSKVCKINPSTKNLPSRFVYIDLESVESGILLQKKVIQLNNAPSRAQRLLENEDIIFQMVRPYQKNNYFFDIKDNYNYVASTGYAQLQANESKKFLFQFLHTDDFVADVLNKCTGSNYPAINSSDLSEIRINIPKSKEQEKIADCLSSIDSLITVQSQKVELLKEHKNGLLEQLFPKDGENVPKLRFLKFANSGKWEEKILNDIVDYENGKAHENDISDNGQYIVVNSKFISTEGEIVKYTDSAFCLANKNDILMVLSDVPNGRAIAKCYLVEFDNLYTVNQRICKLTTKKTISKFLFYIIDRNKYFLSFDDGVKQTNLRKEDVLNCPFLIPPTIEEQKKIADALTSIDKEINLQSQKLEDLKEHKKALLQQLFPKKYN
jgi:type I restriction enzyme S subunit